MGTSLGVGVAEAVTSIPALEEMLDVMRRARTPGVALVRRVLARRPEGAPPTESLLETLMVQLARTVEGLPDPIRQYEVFDADGVFAGRVDLSWPEPGLFVELDGQHHKDQPVYDARRETAVVAATGWLPGRFTWREVVHLPTTTARRLAAIALHVGTEAVAGVITSPVQCALRVAIRASLPRVNDDKCTAIEVVPRRYPDPAYLAEGGSEEEFAKTAKAAVVHIDEVIRGSRFRDTSEVIATINNPLRALSAPTG